MKHKNFFIVPNQIFDLGLKPKELAVYEKLRKRAFFLFLTREKYF